MILIEIRGKIFNPAQIFDITGDNDNSVLWFGGTESSGNLIFNGVGINTLAAEINNAIYDHEYFLEQKRLEARNHFTNPLEK